MDKNYHYYVTYSAARSAGYKADEALRIARAAQYVDECKDTVQGFGFIFLNNLADWFKEKFQNDRKLEAEAVAIWSVYHFLPGDKGVNEEEMNPQLLEDADSDDYLKAHLICQPESRLSGLMVEEAKSAAASGDEKALLRVGITMHVLADTFAHQSFAGVPSGKINRVDWITHGDLNREVNLEKVYLRIPDMSERSFGFMGHGQAGTWPDEPGETLSYCIEWHINEIVRFNPLEFYCAYLKMIEAMKYIRGNAESFSPTVNRAQLLNRESGDWAETERVMKVFTCAGSDKNLAECWMNAGNEMPGEYEKLEGSDEAQFRIEASSHRDFIIGNCGYLRRYLERLRS